METHYLPYDTKNMGNWGREGVLAENISLEQHVYNGCMTLTAVLTFFFFAVRQLLCRNFLFNFGQLFSQFLWKATIAHINSTLKQFTRQLNKIIQSGGSDWISNCTWAPNVSFWENICLEDDLRSRIFGTFSVKFLAYMPLLGFSNI